MGRVKELLLKSDRIWVYRIRPQEGVVCIRAEITRCSNNCFNVDVINPQEGDVRTLVVGSEEGVYYNGSVWLSSRNIRMAKQVFFDARLVKLKKAEEDRKSVV